MAGCASTGYVPGEYDGPILDDEIDTGTPLPGSRYSMKNDAEPEVEVDVSKIPNATPRDEPYSRGGNKTPYEVWGKTYHIMDTHEGYSETGSASWYGKKFHGHKTSNGEIYNMYGMTAAHKSLPIPSYVKVENLANGREVIVRVNDRGPFHSNRIIDLSYAAAKKLGYKDIGTTNVKVTAIKIKGAKRRSLSNSPRKLTKPKPQPVKLKPLAEKPKTNESGTFFVQVGAFSSKDSAEKFEKRAEVMLDMETFVKSYFSSSVASHKILVGPFDDRGTAELYLKAVKLNGFQSAFIKTE